MVMADDYVSIVLGDRRLLGEIAQYAMTIENQYIPSDPRSPMQEIVKSKALFRDRITFRLVSRRFNEVAERLLLRWTNKIFELSDFLTDIARNKEWDPEYKAFALKQISCGGSLSYAIHPWNTPSLADGPPTPSEDASGPEIGEDVYQNSDETWTQNKSDDDTDKIFAHSDFEKEKEDARDCVIESNFYEVIFPLGDSVAFPPIVGDKRHSISEISDDREWYTAIRNATPKFEDINREIEDLFAGRKGKYLQMTLSHIESLRVIDHGTIFPFCVKKYPRNLVALELCRVEDYNLETAVKDWPPNLKELSIETKPQFVASIFEKNALPKFLTTLRLGDNSPGFVRNSKSQAPVVPRFKIPPCVEYLTLSSTFLPFADLNEGLTTLIVYVRDCQYLALDDFAALTLRCSSLPRTLRRITFIDNPSSSFFGRSDLKITLICDDSHSLENLVYLERINLVPNGKEETEFLPRMPNLKVAKDVRFVSRLYKNYAEMTPNLKMWSWNLRSSGTTLPESVETIHCRSEIDFAIPEGVKYLAAEDCSTPIPKGIEHLSLRKTQINDFSTFHSLVLLSIDNPSVRPHNLVLKGLPPNLEYLCIGGFMDLECDIPSSIRVLEVGSNVRGVLSRVSKSKCPNLEYMSGPEWMNITFCHFTPIEFGEFYDSTKTVPFHHAFYEEPWELIRRYKMRKGLFVPKESQ